MLETEIQAGRVQVRFNMLNHTIPQQPHVMQVHVHHNPGKLEQKADAHNTVGYSSQEQCPRLLELLQSRACKKHPVRHEKNEKPGTPSDIAMPDFVFCEEQEVENAGHEQSN